MNKIIFVTILLIPLQLMSQFEFGINATSGIVRTYNHTIVSKNMAPSFRSTNQNQYIWGILFDMKLYKNIFVSFGTEHKAMYVYVSQSFKTSELTSKKFGVGGVDAGHGSGWGYWTFPVRFSYKLYLDRPKNIFVSPNIGLSYMYHLILNDNLSDDNAIVTYNDTMLLLWGFHEKEFKNLNVNLFQIQFGAEAGWKHKFFSLYFGANYSKGLNKMFLYKLNSTEKDLYANTPLINYSETVESRGSNLNLYLGMRFQLYPIKKNKSKTALN